ncbi:hypothetical protein HMPREF0262_02247 [Clostridium sp. ATCC 29733]|nr:hypothetical protein HMPREF0262_02247 [Clostridium sp. ATCC 29733]
MTSARRAAAKSDGPPLSKGGGSRLYTLFYCITIRRLCNGKRGIFSGKGRGGSVSKKAGEE